VHVPAGISDPGYSCAAKSTDHTKCVVLIFGNRSKKLTTALLFHVAILLPEFLTNMRRTVVEVIAGISVLGA
jgi:hypothetical protein